MSKVDHLKIAPSPAKAEMLQLLDELRAAVESGDIMSLVAIPIHPSREWSVNVRGEISALELSGILGRVWLDAMETMKNEC